MLKPFWMLEGYITKAKVIETTIGDYPATEHHYEDERGDRAIIIRFNKERKVM